MSGLGNGQIAPRAGKRRSKLAVGGTRIVAGYGRASTRPGRARLRARAFPGDPSRLPPPESVTETFLALAQPECTRNGEVVMGFRRFVALNCNAVNE